MVRTFYKLKKAVLTLEVRKSVPKALLVKFSFLANFLAFDRFLIFLPPTLSIPALSLPYTCSLYLSFLTLILENIIPNSLLVVQSFKVSKTEILLKFLINFL